MVAAEPKTPETPDGPALAARLSEVGRDVEAVGREPVSLTSSEAVWWVVDGEVEVFAVPETEAGSGRWTHVTTIGAGRMLFGVPPAQARLPFRLQAVGLQGARWIRVELPMLFDVARDPQLAAELGARTEEWIERLFGDLLTEAPPRRFESLSAGRETRLAMDDAARPEGEFVWVRHVSGVSRFLGRPELEISPGAHLVPVPGRAWLVAAEESRLSGVATNVLLRSGALWDSLARFHELYLRWLALRLTELEHDDRLRLGRRLELDQQALETASAHLASVMGDAPRKPPSVGEVTSPLLAVCRRVGEAQGLEIRTPPASEREARRSDPLSRICTASRIRHRRVLLRDDWWRRDGGPLVAYRASKEDAEEGDAQPVALLPTSPRSYELWDPEDGSTAPVDETVAESLEGRAVMFYPPLPEREVGFLDLLRLAFRDRRRDLSTLLLTGAAGGLLALLVPLVTARLFGEVIPDADRTQLVQMAVALGLAAVASGAFQVTRAIAMLRMGGKIDGSVQAAVWDRLMSLPVGFFKRYTVGDLANRAMGIDSIREQLIGNVMSSILGAVFSIFSFALLFWFSWPLAMVAVGLVAVLAVVTVALSWWQLRYQRVLLEVQGKIASLLYGLIHGIAKLRLGGAERRAYALWAERFAEQRRVTWRARQIANVQSVVSAVYAVLTSLTLFAMVGLSVQVDMSVAEFLGFNAAFGQFQAAVLSMIGVVSTVLTLVPVYERLRPVLETVPEVDDTKAEAPELAGDLELSHVSFRYREDGPLVLDDVTIRARPGEMVALVGPSGSGKSTCLRLVLGFEEPASGSIYFDGQDLPSLDLSSVRRQIGVVLQDGRPISGDVFTNIVGSSNLTLDDAWEAAEMAGLADDVREMPMGMHTIISEGATTFSGGQRQRLLIARAIVHKPRILLFDEATSALDNRTQDVVSRSLERLKATRIVVAHRLSTIVGADRIYVLDQGRVEESGSYDELLETDGLFRRLAERQMA